MPFTPAHIAIVLPFIKTNARYVSATGLITGAMAPDFEYFLKFTVAGSYGHSLWGILFFNIPVVLLLSLVFHLIVKRNLISNLPGFLQQRFQPMVLFDFFSYFKTHALIIMVSGAIGACSHILWDSFTHHDGYFVHLLPAYKDLYVRLGRFEYPLWHVMQHVSTLIGLAFVSIYIFKLPRHASPIIVPRLMYWFLLALITIIVVVVRFLIRGSDYNLGNFIVTMISGFCIALIVGGLIRFNSSSIIRN